MSLFKKFWLFFDWVLTAARAHQQTELLNSKTTEKDAKVINWWTTMAIEVLGGRDFDYLEGIDISNWSYRMK